MSIALEAWYIEAETLDRQLDRLRKTWQSNPRDAADYFNLLLRSGREQELLDIVRRKYDEVTKHPFSLASLLIDSGLRTVGSPTDVHARLETNLRTMREALEGGTEPLNNRWNSIPALAEYMHRWDHGVKDQLLGMIQEKIQARDTDPKTLEFRENWPEFEDRMVEEQEWLDKAEALIDKMNEHSEVFWDREDGEDLDWEEREELGLTEGEIAADHLSLAEDLIQYLGENFQHAWDEYRKRGYLDYAGVSNPIDDGHYAYQKSEFGNHLWYAEHYLRTEHPELWQQITEELDL